MRDGAAGPAGRMPAFQVQCYTYRLPATYQHVMQVVLFILTTTLRGPGTAIIADLTSHHHTRLPQILQLAPSVFGKETLTCQLVIGQPSRTSLRTLRNLEVTFLTNHMNRLNRVYIRLSHRSPFNYERINRASYFSRP